MLHNLGDGVMVATDPWDSLTRDAILAHIAAARYRLKHGIEPESFDDLVPEFLERVPIDPYSGNPFRLRRGCFRNGPLMLIYMDGADGTDNGGFDDPSQPGGDGLSSRHPGFDFLWVARREP